MKLKTFKDRIKDFLTFLEVEKNVSIHTLRAYQADLSQVVKFWLKIQQKEKTIKHSFEEVIRRYIVSLFYKKKPHSFLKLKGYLQELYCSHKIIFCICCRFLFL